MTDEQIQNAIRAAVTTQIFSSASEAAMIQAEVGTMVRNTLQAIAKQIRGCETPEDIAKMALLLSGRPVPDESTTIDALRNLLSCIAKQVNAPMSSDTHLNTAIRILAKATKWRPSSQEHKQILEDAIESAVA